jgi:hypothetical protein
MAPALSTSPTLPQSRASAHRQTTAPHGKHIPLLFLPGFAQNCAVLAMSEGGGCVVLSLVDACYIAFESLSHLLPHCTGTPLNSCVLCSSPCPPYAQPRGQRMHRRWTLSESFQRSTFVWLFCTRVHPKQLVTFSSTRSPIEEFRKGAQLELVCFLSIYLL